VLLVLALLIHPPPLHLKFQLIAGDTGFLLDHLVHGHDRSLEVAFTAALGVLLQFFTD
jgi:hypothetical protein